MHQLHGPWVGWPGANTPEWILHSDDRAKAWRLWHVEEGELAEVGWRPPGLPAAQIADWVSHFTTQKVAQRMVDRFLEVHPQTFD
jgi:hypothetical protein